MLKEVEKSRSFMKRMKSKGEMTESWGTPALIECRYESKPSTLMANNLLERRIITNLMRV